MNRVQHQLCSFGSNLFHQTNSDIKASKRINEPQLVPISPGVKFSKIASATDCQTIVEVEAEGSESGIQIWGYDHTQDRVAIRPGTTTTQLINIKQWIGGEEVLGYLDTEGCIHRHNDSPHSTKISAEDCRQYQAVAISGTGLVLAAPTSEVRLAPLLPTDQSSQADTYSCKLELWPSFDSLLAGPSKS
ncbi:uncharacterized protein MELLADRAFT_70414, partial [Melampsora larici-populina 98AG31]